MENNKYIAILGAGESGVGAAMLAKKQGFDVFVSDKGPIADDYKTELVDNGIDWEEGCHTLERILKADEVIKSPGIPEKVEIVQELLGQGTSVISEIEFASRFTNATIIGITGSNGKTTTTSLTYHILKKAGLNVGVAGNIGDSFAKQVATENFDYYVLELSSFQLDGMKEFKADISVLLNVTPDHLDRYENDFSKYLDSKFQIINNQTNEDYFIYCKDDEAITGKLKELHLQVKKMPFSIKEKVEEGAFLEEEQILINIKNESFNMSIHDLALNGKHNLYNSMASGIASRILDLRKDVVRESLSDFQNVEHRLEHVGFINGVEFINDSKATNVNAVWFALESMTKKVIWIAGGVDKGNDYEELMPLIKDKVKAIVCLGTDNSKLHAAFDGVVEVFEANNAIDAVKLSYKIAARDEAVLLSPACASFDLFENYEERGYQFKAAVREL